MSMNHTASVVIEDVAGCIGSGSMSMSEEAVSQFHRPRDGDATILGVEAVVMDATILRVQEDFWGEAIKEEAGVPTIPKGHGDTELLDALFVIPLGVVELRVGACRLDLIQEGIASSHILLEGIVRLGNVPEDVVLGEESTTVKMIPEEHHLSWTKDFGIRDAGGNGLLVALGAMGVGDDESVVRPSDPGSLVLGDHKLGFVQSIDMLVLLSDDGFELLDAILESAFGGDELVEFSAGH